MERPQGRVGTIIVNYKRICLQRDREGREGCLGVGNEAYRTNRPFIRWRGSISFSTLSLSFLDRMCLRINKML